jgi:hypothetical protein
MDVRPLLKEGAESNYFPTLLAAFTNQATLLLCFVSIQSVLNSHIDYER